MFATILNIYRGALCWIFRVLFAGLDPRRDIRCSIFPEMLNATRIWMSPSPRGLLKYPVVIIHGFADIPKVTGIEFVAETVLDELGIEHFTPQIQALGSIFERSESLVEQIAKQYPGRTVHLIAHSMGGLNARDIASSSMITNLGFKILTVTTLATPHRGIKALDFVPDLDDTNAFATFLRKLIGTDLGAAGDMSHDAMTRYNETHRYNPNVKYFTWAGEKDLPSPFFAFTFPITRVFGRTDGLINVHSATWGPDLGGPGTHLGTLHGADHASLVGRAAILGSIPHIGAAEVGEEADVKSVDNSLISAIRRSIQGTIDSLLGPIRVFLANFRKLGST